MLFARRRAPTFWQRARSFAAPSTGYRRALRYRLQRIARMTGSPHYLAGGVATGIALALTPWFGLHFVLAFVLARLARISFPLALGFSLLNNPWTLPFVMIGSYQLGRAILGAKRPHLPPIDQLSWHYLLTEGDALLIPLATGSTILAVAGFCLTYWPLRRKLARMQAERREKMDAKREALLTVRPEPARATA